jgi:hypothetical protein
LFQAITIILIRVTKMKKILLLIFLQGCGEGDPIQRPAGARDTVSLDNSKSSSGGGAPPKKGGVLDPSKQDPNSSSSSGNIFPSTCSKFKLNGSADDISWRYDFNECPQGASFISGILNSVGEDTKIYNPTAIAKDFFMCPKDMMFVGFNSSFHKPKQKVAFKWADRQYRAYCQAFTDGSGGRVERITSTCSDATETKDPDHYTITFSCKDKGLFAGHKTEFWNDLGEKGLNLQRGKKTKAEYSTHPREHTFKCCQFQRKSDGKELKIPEYTFLKADMYKYLSQGEKATIMDYSKPYKDKKEPNCYSESLGTSIRSEIEFMCEENSVLYEVQYRIVPTGAEKAGSSSLSGSALIIEKASPEDIAVVFKCCKSSFKVKPESYLVSSADHTIDTNDLTNTNHYVLNAAEIKAALIKGDTKVSSINIKQ